MDSGPTVGDRKWRLDTPNSHLLLERRRRSRHPTPPLRRSLLLTQTEPLLVVLGLTELTESRCDYRRGKGAYLLLEESEVRKCVTGHKSKLYSVKRNSSNTLCFISFNL